MTKTIKVAAQTVAEGRPKFVRYEDLAAELNCTTVTISRDAKACKEAGVPIFATHRINDVLTYEQSLWIRYARLLRNKYGISHRRNELTRQLSAAVLTPGPDGNSQPIESLLQEIQGC
ncbi:MAG TPA: HTH domain-containing protein [Trichocoleus sp.]